MKTSSYFFTFLYFSIQGPPSRSKNRVRFTDGQNADDNDDEDNVEDDKNGQMSFSPPRWFPSSG